MSISITDAAKVCHEAHRAFCAALGDNSQLPWEEAPEWLVRSAANSVTFLLDNPGAKTSDLHEFWVAEKCREGWAGAESKDDELKTHPGLLMLYGRLPLEQRLKDQLFYNIVSALRPLIKD